MRNLFVVFCFLNTLYCNAQIDSALLLNLHEVNTTSEMDAIQNPVKGSLIHNLEENAVYVYNGVNWVAYNTKQTPYITIDEALTATSGTTSTLVIAGVHFNLATEITIPGITIQNYSVLSPNIIEVTINATAGSYDIVVNNGDQLNTTWANNGKNKIVVQ